MASESLRMAVSPHSEAATPLQSIANESSQVDRLQTYQRMANIHSEKQEVTQLQQLADDSGSVMQLKAIKGGSALTGTVQYETKVNNGIDSAYLMCAKNIKLKDPNNAQLASGNGPNTDPPGWGALQTLGLTNGDPNYKRMHLLNGDLGGSGDDYQNLAPGSSDLNTAHYTKIEKALHTHVLAGRTIDSYDVWAIYRDAGLPRFSNINKSRYKHTLAAIHCQYIISNGASDSKTIYEGPNTAKAWP